MTQIAQIAQIAQITQITQITQIAQIAQITRITRMTHNGAKWHENQNCDPQDKLFCYVYCVFSLFSIL